MTAGLSTCVTPRYRGHAFLDAVAGCLATG
jgi:hypothetical protein